MSTLLAINLILSLIFIMLQHPLSLGLILLSQTITISMISGNFCYNFWFSYIIFLIMVGGMLILFIYMTSIASNEKFKLKFNILFLIPFIILTLIPSMFWNININTLNNDMMNFNLNNLINISMTKLIHFPSYYILMFLISYLFLTLIAVVKISNLNHGPLRQMN
uniref:NADH-ubiquinone oxidoreductase chain 6 n=1 Tax=Tenebrionoidea sp. 21 KM-2017 TaxID=2219477 RepID=A0A346RI61_9CUCU|nr:NADH dehydrogenase subunit 6 [Tenebrionoidea sp. 21 KM-2017]